MKTPLLLILVFCASCNLLPKPGPSDSLNGVRKAYLKIKSRIAFGVNKLEYPALISDLGYEILLAKENELGERDKKALDQYYEALNVLNGAKDVWDVNIDYKACLNRSYSTSSLCMTEFGPAAKRAAEAAQIKDGMVFVGEGVQAAWQVAEQKADVAEATRRGQTK